MFGAHIGPVTASAPALGTISSVPVSFATLAIAIATPECTVPTSTSTLSRLISLLTLSVALAGSLVVDLDELDLAAAELAALLADVEPEAVLDGGAQRGEGAGGRQHQADLELAPWACAAEAATRGGDANARVFSFMCCLRWCSNE